MNLDKIPKSLKDRRQWVLWKTVMRDKPTKVPFQVNGQPASSTGPETWATFEEVVAALTDEYSGIGFVFAADDGFCGVDLDGCRNHEGRVSEWAREIILALDSYAEVSPSETGVKIFCRGKLPFASGKKIGVEAEKVCDKEPGIEVYDHGRYFAVTGERVRGPFEPQERQSQIDALSAKFWPNQPAPRASGNVDWRSDMAVIERARRYVSKMPEAVSGQDGHGATFRVACVLVCGFSLGQDDAMALLLEYNQRCQPPWTERELLHKVSDANKQPGERGYLRNANPDRWDAIKVPNYQPPVVQVEQPTGGPKVTTLSDAALNYIDSIKGGQSPLIEFGIGDLDYAVSGGVEKGEMVIVAARPSHGKSAVALQCIHTWTERKMPCAIVSEEMSALALGKRTVQFVSRVPQEHWSDLSHELESEIENYKANRAQCLIIEGCGTAQAAADAISNAVDNHGIECAVVDYAQLLRSSGKTRYEQITNTSILLRQLASQKKIVLLVLCQLSRGVEGRESFTPVMSDLKDTGQLEQDADVIVFLVWPYRVNPDEPKEKFQFFVAKNRNREIKQPQVVCRFQPDRQMITDAVMETEYERTRGRNWLPD